MNEADAALISTLARRNPDARPAGWSKPLDEPAQFATAGAQLNYEITEMAKRGRSEAGSQRSEKGAKLRDLGSVTPTKDEVLEEFGRADLRPLWLGRIAYLWSEGQPDRATAIKQLRLDLIREDMLSAAARLDQFILLYWIGRILGWDEAQGLRVAAIRELRRLFARDAASDEYSVRRQCLGPARLLWSRMVRDQLTAAAVRAEVDRIRPSRSALKMHGRAGKNVEMLKQLAAWKPKEAVLLEAIRVLQAKLPAQRSSESAVA